MEIRGKRGSVRGHLASIGVARKLSQRERIKSLTICKKCKWPYYPENIPKDEICTQCRTKLKVNPLASGILAEKKCIDKLSIGDT